MLLKMGGRHKVNAAQDTKGCEKYRVLGELSFFCEDSSLTWSWLIYLKRLRVLCSSVRLLLPVRSSSCRVAGSESGNWISVSSLQLKSTSWKV